MMGGVALVCEGSSWLQESKVREAEGLREAGAQTEEDHHFGV